jgi:hypothetical protein
MLNRSMRCHGVTCQTIQVEVGDARIEASTFQIMCLLLTFPTLTTAPLLNQTVTIRFNEWLVLRHSVVREKRVL